MYGPDRPDYVVDCVEVLNGDTIVVEGSAGTRKTVHVHGIAAPEAGQPYGPAATRAARRAVEGRRVEVQVIGEASSGDLVGRVRAGCERLGPRLVRKGFAWHDQDRAPDAASLSALQREARTDGRGLWAQARPVPPWKQRNRPSDTGTAVGALVEFAFSFVREVVPEGPGHDEPVVSAD